MDEGGDNESKQVNEQIQGNESKDAVDEHAFVIEGVDDDEEYQALYGDILLNIEAVKAVDDAKNDDHFDKSLNQNKVELVKNAEINIAASKSVNANVAETKLFVKDLEWWTTDSDLEYELYMYGKVKEVNFFTYPDNGVSMGCCEVEFLDPVAAAACKDGMNGHMFNQKPCVVQFGSFTPNQVLKMVQEQNNKSMIQLKGPLNAYGNPDAGVRPDASVSSKGMSGNPQPMNKNLPIGRPKAPKRGMPSVVPYGNPGYFGGVMNPFGPYRGMGMPRIGPYSYPTYPMGGPNMGMWHDPNKAVLGDGGEAIRETDSRMVQQEKTNETDRGSHETYLSSSKHGKLHGRDITRAREWEHSRNERERKRRYYKNDRDKCADDHYRHRDKSPGNDDERKRERIYSSNSRHREYQHSRSRDKRYTKK